jgi:hypothetical protein
VDGRRHHTHSADTEEALDPVLSVHDGARFDPQRAPPPTAVAATERASADNSSR